MRIEKSIKWWRGPRAGIRQGRQGKTTLANMQRLGTALEIFSSRNGWRSQTSSRYQWTGYCLMIPLLAVLYVNLKNQVIFLLHPIIYSGRTIEECKFLHKLQEFIQATAPAILTNSDIKFPFVALTQSFTLKVCAKELIFTANCFDSDWSHDKPMVTNS